MDGCTANTSADRLAAQPRRRTGAAPGVIDPVPLWRILLKALLVGSPALLGVLALWAAIRA